MKYFGNHSGMPWVGGVNDANDANEKDHAARATPSAATPHVDAARRAPPWLRRVRAARASRAGAQTAQVTSTGAPHRKSLVVVAPSIELS